jgi:FkbM family methyltransferase
MDTVQISNSYREKLKKWHSLADLFFNKLRFLGSRKLYRSISKAFLPRLKHKIFSPTIYGFDLVVGPDNAYDYYYLGFYEVGALNIFKKVLKKDDVFIDVGANIGLMSYYASKLIGEKGKVIAIEPTKKFYEDLTAGINQNNFKNIIPLKIGLGKEKGSFPIYFNNVCPSLIKTNENDPYELVEIDTLDEVLAVNNISKVKLIKIDVEGFELEVVKGGKQLFSSSNAPVVCIEYVRDQQMILEEGKNALDLLKELNSYRFFQLEKSSDTVSKLIEIHDFKNLHKNDNVFCFLENHISEYIF